MRISDWSSDVCSSDLRDQVGIERNPGIGIVKNDRAFDPTFVVAGLMDSLFKGAGANPIYIQLRPPQAMPNNPNAPDAEAGKIADAIELVDGSEGIDEDGTKLLGFRHNGRAS